MNLRLNLPWFQCCCPLIWDSLPSSIRACLPSHTFRSVLLGQQNRTILVADKFFSRFLHDRRQIFVGRFYWQTKLANFIVHLTSALERTVSSRPTVLPSGSHTSASHASDSATSCALWRCLFTHSITYLLLYWWIDSAVFGATIVGIVAFSLDFELLRWSHEGFLSVFTVRVYWHANSSVAWNTEKRTVQYDNQW